MIFSGSVPFIILVRPQLPENLGTVARGMMNFSLSHLRLVQPVCSPCDPKALATSAGAGALLEKAQLFPTLQEAIGDLGKVYGTSAREREIIKSYKPLGVGLAEEVARVREERWGIVFGPERTGLTNDELTLCSEILYIPVNPAFPSLNLGQSVTLAAYEWMKTQSGQVFSGLRTGQTTCALRQEIYEFLERLEADLDRTNYWRVASKKERMKRTLYNIFTRMEITRQELQTLRGLLHTLQQ